MIEIADNVGVGDVAACQRCTSSLLCLTHFISHRRVTRECVYCRKRFVTFVAAEERLNTYTDPECPRYSALESSGVCDTCSKERKISGEWQ